MAYPTFPFSSRRNMLSRLPAITDDLIFSYLTPKELIRCSKVCRETRARVKLYERRAFSIDKHLARFFTFYEIYLFRNLQYQTGMLVSGSTALQFFDRSDYGPESDLDIYVEHRYARTIAYWLRSIGYVFVARDRQNPVLDQAYEDANEQYMLSSVFTCMPSVEAGYFGRGVATVMNFHKENPNRKIQLITSLTTPLEIILHFHSTCVMNIITHSTAYSLYPKATFEDRRSLVCDTKGSKQEAAREKYQSRGWRMEHTISYPENRQYSRTGFMAGDRWVGDPLCWTMKLQPALRFGPDHDVVTLNMWSLQYADVQEDPRLVFKAEMNMLLISAPSMRYWYSLINDDGVAREWQAILNWKRERFNQQVHSVPPLFQSFRTDEVQSFDDKDLLDLVKSFRAERWRFTANRSRVGLW